MGTRDDPIDLVSDEDDCMSLGSEDGDQQDFGESWICRHCTLCNPPYAGDCSTCGLPNRGAAIAGTTGNGVVDLTAPRPSLDAQTLSYVKSSVSLEGAVALDVCGCVVDRQELKAHIQQQAAHMPSHAPELDRHFCCMNGGCGKPLARRDIVSMVDAQSTRKMDEHTYRVFQAHTQAAVSQKSGRFFAKKSRLTPEPASLRQALSLVAAIAALQTALGVPQASANGVSREANGAANGSTTRSAAAAAAAATKAKAVVAIQQKAADKKPPKNAAAQANGIAKGTGYGGDKGYFSMGHVKQAGAQGPAQQATVQRARDREAAADKATLNALLEVKACIDAAAGRMSGNLLQSLSVSACGVAFGGPLAFLLRSLLQNDSLMDIKRRSELYWAVVRLVQSLGTCVDCIPIFLKPAGPEEAHGSSMDPSESAGSMLDAMRTLDIQCRVFKRHAEDLASEDEIAALSLALEINNSFEELQKAADVLNAAQQRLEASIAGRPSFRGLQPEEDQASIERRYCAAVGKYRLCQWPLVQLRDFYFRAQAEKAGAFSAKMSMLRVGQEMSSLATSLPVAWASSVFLVADDNRMDIIRALIVGPAGTPYENGIYLFDILLPPEYPEKPPKVQFLTTGGGTVRFNPNLYICGKVCLSLLGTWSGPAWDPATSTLLQVLVSIQSMIFIEDPYFNEPGHEATAGSSQGQARSTTYNRNICAQNLQHALLPAVLKPPPAFKELLKVHFKFKHNNILKQLETWQAADSALKISCEQIRSAMDQYRTKEGLPIGT